MTKKEIENKYAGIVPKVKDSETWYRNHMTKVCTSEEYDMYAILLLL